MRIRAGAVVISLIATMLVAWPVSAGRSTNLLTNGTVDRTLRGWTLSDPQGACGGTQYIKVAKSRTTSTPVIDGGAAYLNACGSHTPDPSISQTVSVQASTTYVVSGIYEREGATIYNTAVLIDRKGNVAGKYRKVYLPREEVERGLTPGLHFPVFQTDFGKVGLMICYDVFFAEPARALANQGADMILMPIWGGDETLAKARAIENGVFLITSGYDHPTYIMDPFGERLSQAREEGTAAVATQAMARVAYEEGDGSMSDHALALAREAMKAQLRLLGETRITILSCGCDRCSGLAGPVSAAEELAAPRLPHPDCREGWCVCEYRPVVGVFSRLGLARH